MLTFTFRLSPEANVAMPYDVRTNLERVIHFFVLEKYGYTAAADCRINWIEDTEFGEWLHLNVSGVFRDEIPNYVLGNEYTKLRAFAEQILNHRHIPHDSSYLVRLCVNVQLVLEDWFYVNQNPEGVVELTP